jgi:3-oxoacyl-(acyl-carrier-protein) synthase
MRRVAVTGIGVVSPFGEGVETLWDAVSNGRSGIHDLHHLDVSQYTTRFGGYVDDFDASAVIDLKEQRRMARFQQFAVVAAHEALADAGLLEQVLAHRKVFFGYGWMDYTTIQRGTLRLLPLDHQRATWHQDYAAMRREMFFGPAPDFETMLARIDAFARRFNGS